jgi:hypothetical protein
MPSMNSGRAALFSGTGAADNALLFTTTNVQQYSVFQLMTTDGTADVEATLDGINWTVVPIAMADLGATASATYVVVTAVNRMYQFRGKYTQIRVRAAGAAATGTLLCGND